MAGSLKEFEALSKERWQEYRQSPKECIVSGDAVPPALLYFRSQKPDSVINSGLYLSFLDFKDVQRDIGVRDEALAMHFHSIVIHFAHDEPEYFHAIYRSIRNNPYNQASWNTRADTYHYFLRLAVLEPYALPSPASEHKIPGFGKQGRTVLRACIDEGFIDDVMEKREAAKIADQRHADLV